MSRLSRRCLLVAAVFACPILISGAAAAKEPQHDAVKPVPRAGGWMVRHEKMNERVKQGDVGLLMIGDSITQGWEGAGKKVWQQYYDKRKAVNLGIGGDRTQHVIWRLENGNIEGIDPKLAVLMIGTNNSGTNSPQEIAEGVTLIVNKLRKELPDTKVLILAIFPRGENDDDKRRQVNTKVNEQIAKLADGKMVFYKDIGENFLEKDRTLSRKIMPDLLHLSPEGYTIWAEAIEPDVAKHLGEKE